MLNVGGSKDTAAVFGFNIGRNVALVHRRLVHPRPQISRLFNQGGRELWISGRSGELEERRRLTRKIKSAYHGISPIRPVGNVTQEPSVCSGTIEM